MSAVHQLAKHLTEDNHRELLERAKHKSSREIERLVAEIAPKPDVPSCVRPLPRRREASIASALGMVVERESQRGGETGTAASATVDLGAGAANPNTTGLTPAVLLPSLMTAAIAILERGHWSITTFAPTGWEVDTKPTTSPCAAGLTTNTRLIWISGRSSCAANGKPDI